MFEQRPPSRGTVVMVLLIVLALMLPTLIFSKGSENTEQQTKNRKEILNYLKKATRMMVKERDVMVREIELIYLENHENFTQSVVDKLDLKFKKIKDYSETISKYLD